MPVIMVMIGVYDDDVVTKRQRAVHTLTFVFRQGRMGDRSMGSVCTSTVLIVY